MANILTRALSAIRYYAQGLYDRLGNDHAYLMSGGLAFSLFSCAVPLALVIISALGTLFSRPEVATEIFATVDSLVPYPEQAVEIKQFLANRFSEMSSGQELIGIVGLIILFFASTGLFSSLRTILNRVFRFRKTESVLIGKLWDVAMVVIVLIMGVLLMMTLPLIKAVSGWAGEIEWLSSLELSWLTSWLVDVLTLVSLTVVFSAIFWLVPVRKPNRRAMFVGALTSAALWILAKELFGYYLSHALTLKHVYGVYTFIVAVAFWLYYSAMILIIGAEVGQLNYERKRDKAKAEQAAINRLKSESDLQ